MTSIFLRELIVTRIFKKTGIFGFGKTIYEDFCDVCQAQLNSSNPLVRKEDVDESMYCRQCAVKLGIDLEPHSWRHTDSEIFRYDSRDFFLDKIDGQEKIVYSCCHCDGLLVAIKTGDRISRKYYKVGSKNSSSISYKCYRVQHSQRYSGDGHVKNMLTCQHEFITVASNFEDSYLAEKKLKEIKLDDSHILVEMYGHLDYESIAYGKKYIWCSKCGLHHSLSKSRLKELNSKGINLDWYVK